MIEFFETYLIGHFKEVLIFVLIGLLFARDMILRFANRNGNRPATKGDIHLLMDCIDRNNKRDK